VLWDNVLIQRSGGGSQELSRSIAWRAGCGRSARPVREGGRRVVSPLLPHLPAFGLVGDHGALEFPEARRRYEHR
jgi:hypothetical protein